MGSEDSAALSPATGKRTKICCCCCDCGCDGERRDERKRTVGLASSWLSSSSGDPDGSPCWKHWEIDCNRGGGGDVSQRKTLNRWASVWVEGRTIGSAGRRMWKEPWEEARKKWKELWEGVHMKWKEL